ncbi:hypothetical protein SAMN05444279_11562 [Ruegeria intermedia]|uniref:Uncharacterized protein n=1 Tax=Ruegeria intermedia TaxID=996115 RepID=A0A1M4YFU5_9RHOB|nr:hypothetical protein [Ruegeria intermedia]SHF04600.1 hypothetical protein SAMN05444279_11562 [Ruegeria intermedia]
MRGFEAVMLTQNFAATAAAVMLEIGDTNNPPTTPDEVAVPKEPRPETPEVDAVDRGESDPFCFDAQAFLDEIAGFL